MDGQLGRLFEHLKRSGLYDESLIIVTSDHGQAMKEPRKFPYYGHGNFLYQELVEVPLVVKFPRSARVKVEEGYQSLVGIKQLVEGVVEGKSYDLITGEVAFSEVFGFDLASAIRGDVLPKGSESAIAEIFRPRKAVYKGGHRLVVDGKSGEIEEFSKGGKGLRQEENKKELRDMVSELELFRGNEKFLMPEV